MGSHQKLDGTKSYGGEDFLTGIHGDGVSSAEPPSITAHLSFCGWAGKLMGH